MPVLVAVLFAVLAALRLAIAAAPAVAAPTAADPARPNVVFILTDNQGAWTLGCYGNPDIRTPHVDRLAAEGLRFTRALASNPVCSPTRATFLTGLLPSQHGVHSFLGPAAMMGPEARCQIAEFRSLGGILHDAGYVCGLVGKWHLGDHLHPAEGFSTWITKPGGHTVEFYDQEVIDNGKLRREPGSLTDLWTREGVAFLERNRERPFFLFLAYNGPYLLGDLMQKPARNRHAAAYRGHRFASFPVDSMHPWQVKNKEFHNTQAAMERAAAEVSGIDDGVGEVMATLGRLGLDERTLVIYASDQGWMGGQNGMWGMGDHFRPIGAHEWMMRIPLVFRQPGRIPAGRTSDRLVSNYDLVPTVLGHLGLADRVPREPRGPGRDLAPLLADAAAPGFTAESEPVFYEMENTRAIRTDRWKLVRRHPDGPHELYDMQADPMERVNLYGQPGTDATAETLRRDLERFFATYADPRYDLWRDGTSKAPRLTR
jgi:arylsulfatase A-like enzyme